MESSRRTGPAARIDKRAVLSVLSEGAGPRDQEVLLKNPEVIDQAYKGSHQHNFNNLLSFNFLIIVMIQLICRVILIGKCYGLALDSARTRTSYITALCQRCSVGNKRVILEIKE